MKQGGASALLKWVKMNAAKEIVKQICGFEVDFDDLPQVSSDCYSQSYELDNEQVKILKQALPKKFQESHEDFLEVLEEFGEDEEPIFYITIEQNWIIKQSIDLQERLD